jgi:two-component system, response regulator
MDADPVRILLVEDNDCDLELALRALATQNLCHNISVARDGAEALDFVFCRGKHASRLGADLPDLILLDLNLPLIGGMEVLREIRAHPRTRCVPVVVLTTSDDERDVVESYMMGVNSYVRKPIVFAQFVEAVEKIVTYWLLVNRSVSPRASFASYGQRQLALDS